MKKGYFSSFISAEAIRSSERHFDLVVQTFDHAARNGLLGSEVVEQDLPMLGQTFGRLLEGGQAGAPDLSAPAVQELPRPSRRTVTPEVLEGGYQPIGADGRQTRMFQVAHASAFLGRPVLTVLKQRPAQFLEPRHQASLSHGSGLAFADVIHSFIEQLADVEAVQNMQGGQSFLDRPQVRLPHVGTDIANVSADLRSQAVEARKQGLLLAVMAHPQQA